MHHTTCHCGVVHIEIDHAPSYVIDCNCSICRRYGALWSIFNAEKARVKTASKNLQAYVWGAARIRTMRCIHCGCVTHWESIDTQKEARIGINMRQFDSNFLQTIKVRRFDGAESWTYLDEAE